MFTLIAKSPNKYEILMDKAFAAVKADIAASRKQARIYENIGKKKLAQAEYDKINTYFYVIYYFTLIKMYIYDRLKKNITTTYEDIDKKYSISTMKATVGCLGVNVDKLMEIFYLKPGLIIGIGALKISTTPRTLRVGVSNKVGLISIPPQPFGDDILVDNNGDIIITDNNNFIDI